MKSKLPLISLVAFLPFTFHLSANCEDLTCVNELEFQQIACNHIPQRLITRLDSHGRNIELDDGAIWSIHGEESQTIASKWKMNDSIVIHPTIFPVWTGTQVYLFKERTGTTANANIAANPFVGVPTQIQINYIDYEQGIVQLVDGSGRVVYCRMNNRYYTEYSRWRIGQTLMIGSNEECYAGWLSNYPLILINVERKNHGYVQAVMD